MANPDVVSSSPLNLVYILKKYNELINGNCSPLAIIFITKSVFVYSLCLNFFLAHLGSEQAIP